MVSKDESYDARPSDAPVLDSFLRREDESITDNLPIPQLDRTTPTSIPSLDLQYISTSGGNSTKDLVNRFESFTIPAAAATFPAVSPRRLERAPSSKGLHASSLTPEFPAFGKAQSVIRKSWKNIIDVLKPKDHAVRPAGEGAPEPPQGRNVKNRKSSRPTDVHFTAPIYVLSEDGSQWAPCIGKLRGLSLHITPDVCSGATWSRSLPLSSCNDVRSLARGNLEEDERNVISSHVGTEPKVFELVFNNLVTERLAADSVQARAAWVSSIWDTLLRTPLSKQQTPSSSTSTTKMAEVDNSPVVPRGTTVISQPPASSAPACSSRPSSTPNEEYSRISYASVHPPPVPAKVPFHAHSTPQRQLRPQSELLNSTQKRPSIAALAKRSSVRDRVGQINGMNADVPFPRSTPSRTFTKPSEVIWKVPRPVPLLDTPISLSRKARTTSSGSSVSEVDSLLDAYRASSANDDRPSVATSFEHADHGTGGSVALLHDQISRLQAEVSQLSAKLERTIERDAHPPTRMDDESAHFLKGMQLFKDEILSALANLHQSVRGIEQRQLSPKLSEDLTLAQIKLYFEELVKRKEAVTNDALAAELLHIAKNVGEMRKAVHGDLMSVMETVEASKMQDERKMEVLAAKLHQVLDQVSQPSEVSTRSDLNEVKKKLHDIEATSKTSEQLQVESGKYLAEMCTWLDAFIKYSTSKQDQMAITLEQLFAWLGTNSQGGASMIEDTNLARGLAISMPVEANSATIAKSMNDLVATVKTSLGTDAQARNALYHTLLQQIPERQRQDQTQMLRALATELSSEIKGERLRFVDAMKEATTLNVHWHVEQFKAHLSQEVHVMTQEVVRLQRERDTLEQRTGELRRSG